MTLVQALALTLLSLWSCGAQESFSFGCNTMDITNSPKRAAITTTFPGRMTCVRKPNSKDIWADVYAEKPYIGVMMQVQKSNGDTVGTFRTARGDSSNPKAVGDLYVVGCPNDRAQYSRDQTAKTQTLGTWTGHGSSEDLNREQLYCVFTVVETTQQRYVKVKVRAESRSTRPTKPNFSVSQARNTAPSPKPRPVQPVRKTQPSPAPRPRSPPSPPRQNTKTTASKKRGSTRVDGHQFFEHCVDSSGRKRLPVKNSDCLSYYTATRSRGVEHIRAYQTCGFGMALSVSTCECRPDNRVSCGAGTITKEEVRIYDNSNNRAGSVVNEKRGNSKTLNVRDSTNPSGLPRVLSSGQPSGGQSGIGALLSILTS